MMPGDRPIDVSPLDFVDSDAVPFEIEEFASVAEGDAIELVAVNDETGRASLFSRLEGLWGSDDTEPVTEVEMQLDVEVVV